AGQGGEGGWHGRGGGEVAGGAQLQDVEAVVAADEQVGQEAGSQVRRVAAEHEALAGAHRHDDLRPVAGRHQHAVDLPWRVQQSAVGADQGERVVAGGAEVVDARVGGVEDSRPHLCGGRLLVGAEGAVDGNGVAEDAGVPVGCLQAELVAAGELLVLDDQRDVVDAVPVRQVGRAGFAVVDEEQPGQAPVHVLGRVPVRVWVIPQRGGGLVDDPAG